MARLSGREVAIEDTPFVPDYRIPAPPAGRAQPAPAPGGTGTGGGPDVPDGAATDGGPDAPAAVGSGGASGSAPDADALARMYAEARAEAQAEARAEVEAERRRLQAEMQAALAAREDELARCRSALEEEYRLALGALRALAEDLKEADRRARADWMDAVARKAADVLGEVLARTVLQSRTEAEALSAEIRQQLAGWMSAAAEIRVRVPERLAAALEEALPACRIVADSGLADGEVVVEGPFGVLDGRAQALESGIREVIADGLGEPPGQAC